ncbi:MAG: hypothetical protein J7M34_08325 [Anaerolineae bacterium]|nr:hypothetical protein [Anaerolineae bacterium]
MRLIECLESRTVETLKPLADLCGVRGVTRKADVIAGIVAVMTSPEGLRQQWEQLDELSRAAVAHAVHNGGELDESAFRARYGRVPERLGRLGWYLKPTRLDLFLYNHRIPDDVLPLLESWVPRPEPFRLQGMLEAPKVVKQGKYQLELQRADTEVVGQQDLATFLRLVEQGEVRVTSTTRLPTANTVKKLLPLLAGGDFLPIEGEKIKAASTIRPVGLTRFALYGGLAQHTLSYTGSKLELTEAGRSWLRTQGPELLLDAFETWTHSDVFDELLRIQNLRGQKARRTRLSPPSGRRERIVEALSWCPVNVWIDVEQFFRAIRIWQLDFDVELTPYTNLYVGPLAEYGWLNEYGDETYWRLVHGLYILTVLWEGLASIGALDILYLRPEEADYSAKVDYYDELYFSRYDGLRYFRINKLGAYLFGQAAEYTPYEQTRPPFLRVTDDLMIHIIAPQFVGPADRMFLNSFTTPVDDQSYRVDLNRLLAALTEGRDPDVALEFLAQGNDGPLPEAVRELFAEAKDRSQAFSAPKRAFKIQARTPELAQMAMQDPKLRRFCKLLDDRTLVIPANRERTFRGRLQELGYIIPQS